MKMDFSSYTKEDLDNLPEEVFSIFSEADYQAYLQRNKELGRFYEVGGNQKHFFDEPFYGNGAKALSKKDNGEWEIGTWACGPAFDKYPRVVDEETFIKIMLEKGVPGKKINEFIKYEVNWDEF